LKWTYGLNNNILFFGGPVWVWIGNKNLLVGMKYTSPYHIFTSRFFWKW
jgi:hypothetical protein